MSLNPHNINQIRDAGASLGISQNNWLSGSYPRRIGHQDLWVDLNCLGQPYLVYDDYVGQPENNRNRH